MTTAFFLGLALGGLVGVYGARRGWTWRKVMTVAAVLYVLAAWPNFFA